MEWFGVVVRGHSMSLEMAPFDRAHTSCYYVIHSNYNGGARLSSPGCQCSPPRGQITKPPLKEA